MLSGLLNLRLVDTILQFLCKKLWKSDLIRRSQSRQVKMALHHEMNIAKTAHLI